MFAEVATILQDAANTCTATSAPADCQPSWLDTGSNSWQLTAATFVGLMSVPGLAVLYGGLVPKKWVVNTMFMAFTGFSTVLVVWVLWAYKMGFGSPVLGGHANTYDYTYGGNFFKNFFYNFVGHPETSLKGTAETSQATLADRYRVAALAGADIAVLFPVCIRRNYPAAVPGQRARADQGQGLARVRPALDNVRLFGERHAPVGRRLLGARGRGGLFRRIRDPFGRRHERFRCGLGHRAKAGA